jgi:hypothetical protein
MPPGPPEPATLSVCCYAGIGNRLRVLISGLALAEATGRRFSMVWPRTPHCAAAFPELFASKLNVVEAEPPDIGLWPTYGGWFDRPTPELLRSAAPHVVLSTTDWLVQPEIHPSQVYLLPRCAAILDELKPAAYVCAQVETFRAAHFRPAMIGVHLRRGDFRRSHPGSASNTPQAIAEVARQLEASPEAGVLLCSDDGAVDHWTGRPWRDGVREQFTRRFGERVISTQPRTLDRCQPEAAQDALVDLLLLRQTQSIVGTRGSSFTEMAVFGRRVPRVICASGGGSDPISRWAARSGLQRLVQRAVFRRYGKDVPVRVLFYHYTARPRGWLRQFLKRRAPGIYQWIHARRGLA